LEKYCANDKSKRLAYYYFDFNNQRTLQIDAVLRSLILQLEGQRAVLSEAVEALYERCNNGRSAPGSDHLASVLFQLLNEPLETFLVIDALDECPMGKSDGRKRFHELITAEASNIHGHFHLLVTSRKEDDIERAMKIAAASLVLHEVAIRNADVDNDVRSHVRNTIQTHDRLKRYTEKIQNEIEDKIVTSAQGM
jgi:hypothetical protein